MTARKKNKVTARERAFVKRRVRKFFATMNEIANEIANEASRLGFTSEQIAMMFFSQLARALG